MKPAIPLAFICSKSRVMAAGVVSVCSHIQKTQGCACRGGVWNCWAKFSGDPAPPATIGEAAKTGRRKNNFKFIISAALTS